MNFLALDISTKTGYAVFNEGQLVAYGVVEVGVAEFNVKDFPNKNPAYPYNLLAAARAMAAKVVELCETYQPALVVIENTVLGRNRHTQRLLEFIHMAVLEALRPFRVHYLDPGEWRKILEMRLTTLDKKNNRKVSEGKQRGRITRKHLSVRWVNSMFNLNLKLKDNDVADAICLGKAYDSIK